MCSKSLVLSKRKEQNFVFIHTSVSENRVLRRPYGNKRKEMVGGWRRMHDEELYNL
jgi:hypothetical protein